MHFETIDMVNVLLFLVCVYTCVCVDECLGVAAQKPEEGSGSSRVTAKSSCDLSTVSAGNQQWRILCM